MSAYRGYMPWKSSSTYSSKTDLGSRYSSRDDVTPDTKSTTPRFSTLSSPSTYRPSYSGGTYRSIGIKRDPNSSSYSTNKYSSSTHGPSSSSLSTVSSTPTTTAAASLKEPKDSGLIRKTNSRYGSAKDVALQDVTPSKSSSSNRYLSTGHLSSSSIKSKLKEPSNHNDSSTKSQFLQRPPSINVSRVRSRDPSPIHSNSSSGYGNTIRSRDPSPVDHPIKDRYHTSATAGSSSKIGYTTPSYRLFPSRNSSSTTSSASSASAASPSTSSASTSYTKYGAVRNTGALSYMTASDATARCVKRRIEKEERQSSTKLNAKENDTNSSDNKSDKNDQEKYVKVSVVSRATSPTPVGHCSTVPLSSAANSTTPTNYLRSRRIEISKTVEKIIDRPVCRPKCVDKEMQSDRLDDSTKYSRFCSTSSSSSSSASNSASAAAAAASVVPTTNANSTTTTDGVTGGGGGVGSSPVNNTRSTPSWSSYLDSRNLSRYGNNSTCSSNLNSNISSNKTESTDLSMDSKRASSKSKESSPIKNQFTNKLPTTAAIATTSSKIHTKQDKLKSSASSISSEKSTSSSSSSSAMSSSGLKLHKQKQTSSSQQSLHSIGKSNKLPPVAPQKSESPQKIPTSGNTIQNTAATTSNNIKWTNKDFRKSALNVGPTDRPRKSRNSSIESENGENNGSRIREKSRTERSPSTSSELSNASHTTSSTTSSSSSSNSSSSDSKSKNSTQASSSSDDDDTRNKCNKNSSRTSLMVSTADELPYDKSFSNYHQQKAAVRKCASINSKSSSLNENLSADDVFPLNPPTSPINNDVNNNKCTSDDAKSFLIRTLGSVTNLFKVKSQDIHNNNHINNTNNNTNNMNTLIDTTNANNTLNYNTNTLNANATLINSSECFDDNNNNINSSSSISEIVRQDTDHFLPYDLPNNKKILHTNNKSNNLNESETNDNNTNISENWWKNQSENTSANNINNNNNNNNNSDNLSNSINNTEEFGINMKHKLRHIDSGELPWWMNNDDCSSTNTTTNNQDDDCSFTNNNCKNNNNNPNDDTIADDLTLAQSEINDLSSYSQYENQIMNNRRLRKNDSAERDWWLSQNDDNEQITVAPTSPETTTEIHNISITDNNHGNNNISNNNSSSTSKYRISHIKSGERAWWLNESTPSDEIDCISKNTIQKTTNNNEEPANSFYKIRHNYSGDKAWWNTDHTTHTTSSSSDSKNNAIANNSLNQNDNNTKFKFKIRHVESGEKAWWLQDEINDEENENDELNKIVCKKMENVHENQGKKKTNENDCIGVDDEEEEDDDDDDEDDDDDNDQIKSLSPPLGDRASPEGLEDNTTHINKEYVNEDCDDRLHTKTKSSNLFNGNNNNNNNNKTNCNNSKKLFISRHTNIDDLLGGACHSLSPLLFERFSLNDSTTKFEEISPSQVRIHDSTAQRPIIQRMANDIDENRDKWNYSSQMLDDASLQVYKDGDFGAYLDLESSLAEQSEEIEGLNASRKNSVVVRTQLSVRVHTIIEKLRTSEGRELRHALFSLKQIFQEDKDLVHGFVGLGGLHCLVQVGRNADQNYQNYILRALGQVMLYVDGMNGVMKHGPTIQWLYSLIASKYRLVVKTALKLLLVFVEYVESNCYLLVRAVHEVDGGLGILPWTNIMRLLKDYESADTELLIYATSLINKTLSGLSDQDSFYDESDFLEQQGMEGVVQRYMSRPGTDLDLLDQLQLYESVLKFEDGETDGIRIADNSVRKTLRYRSNNINPLDPMERRKSRRHSTGNSPINSQPPPPPPLPPPLPPSLTSNSNFTNNNILGSIQQTVDEDSSSSGNSGELNEVFGVNGTSTSTSTNGNTTAGSKSGAGVTPGLRRRRERAERQKTFLREQQEAAATVVSNGTTTNRTTDDGQGQIVTAIPVRLQNGNDNHFINNNNNNKQNINNNNNNTIINNHTQFATQNITTNGHLDSKLNIIDKHNNTNNNNNSNGTNTNGNLSIKPQITKNGFVRQCNKIEQKQKHINSSHSDLIILNITSKSVISNKMNNNINTANNTQLNQMNGNSNGYNHHKDYETETNRLNSYYNKLSTTNSNHIKNGYNNQHTNIASIIKPIIQNCEINNSNHCNSDNDNNNNNHINNINNNNHSNNNNNNNSINSKTSDNNNINDINNNTNNINDIKNNLDNNNNKILNGHTQNTDLSANNNNNININNNNNNNGSSTLSLPITLSNNSLSSPIAIPSNSNDIHNGNITSDNGMSNGNVVPNTVKLDNIPESGNEDKKLLLQLKRDHTVKDLTQKLRNLPMSPQEDKPQSRIGDMSGLISKAKEGLAKSKSKGEISRSPSIDQEIKKVEPKKSENELHWEELIKNISRPLKLCDVDFTDLNDEDDTDGLPSRGLGGAIPPPPPPLGMPPPCLLNFLNGPKIPNMNTNAINGDANGSSIKKTKKTVKLFWKEVRDDLVPPTILGKTIWDELPKSNVDTKKLEELFESRAKDLHTKKQQDLNKSKEVIVLDHKRSNAINIAMTKLPPPRAIKAAILKMDATVVTREGIDKLLNMLPTDEERGKIQEAQMSNPELPLGSAEQFLLTLGTISELSARLKLWAFKLDFENSEKEIVDPLNDLKQGLELLKNNKTFKCIISTLLSIGIFLNGAPVKGFQIEYLAKVPEVKDTVQKHSLLHHLCHMVMETSTDTTDLYSEIGPITRASKADFHDLAHNITCLETECKASWDRLKLIAKHDCPAQLNQKLVDFLADCAERIITLDIVHRRVINRYRKFLLWLGVPHQHIVESRPNEICRIISEFALEYRTTRERVHQQIEKKANHRERNKTRGKMIIDVAKFRSQEDRADAELRQLLGTPKTVDNVENPGVFTWRRRRAENLQSPNYGTGGSNSFGSMYGNGLKHNEENFTDGDDEILESLVKTATKASGARPTPRERKRTRHADRKSLRRTLKNGLSEEERQHVATFIKGY